MVHQVGKMVKINESEEKWLQMAFLYHAETLMLHLVPQILDRGGWMCIGVLRAVITKYNQMSGFVQLKFTASLFWTLEV